MNDGRIFTDWNYRTPTLPYFTSAMEYRKALQNNADSIMRTNMQTAQHNIGDYNTLYSVPIDECADVSRDMHPYLYKSLYDDTRPFGYETSDLKEQYLSMEQLYARLNVPMMTQAEYIQNHYPNPN